MPDSDSLNVRVTADTADFRREMAECDRLATSFGAAITGSFRAAVMQGQNFGEVVSGLALKLSGLALSAAFKPFGEALSGGLESLLGGAFSSFAGMFGKGMQSFGSVTPFADGGIIASPSYFPLPQGGAGLMGEAGTEAVMPLQRMSDGRLGVAAGGGGGHTIVMNVTTPDAGSFSRSEAELTAMLARMVGRGQRSL